LSEATTVLSLNSIGEEELRSMFRAVCHSSKWIEEMLDARPFHSVEDLRQKGAEAWARCGQADWMDALQGHPRIGERQGGAGRDAKWSRGEQSAAAGSDEAVKQELRQKQLAYEERFGFLFLICATGKSSEEILNALDHRLEQTPEQELPTVAEELGKIITLRLEKLTTP
jgi:OHCU decarboxylase